MEGGEEMAGSLALAVTAEPEKAITAAIREPWEVQYSRFFSFASLSQTSATTLVPLPESKRNRRRGAWLSSAPSAADLQLFAGVATPEVVLVVSFSGNTLEEHCLNKLHFSWPQVSCVSGFPARGSRTVLVSYRDCKGQVQKFALRFPTIDKTQMFMDVLKGILKEVSDFGVPISSFRSEISAQSEILPSCKTPYRAGDELKFLASADTSTTEMPVNTDYRVEQYSLSEETAPNSNIESILSVLPPTFTSLMTNCSSVGERVQLDVSSTNDLKAQITKFMDDSSFQDILNKVEEVIGDMGYIM